MGPQPLGTGIIPRTDEECQEKKKKTTTQPEVFFWDGYHGWQYMLVVELMRRSLESVTACILLINTNDTGNLHYNAVH